MTSISAMSGLAASAYTRHKLHTDDRIWPEKNCYVDLWIEVLHALNLNPVAMLPFVVSVDFEGDQWTFFKPRHEELRLLYGIDVQELTIWKPLLDHVREHVAAGKLVSTEADAFWLPDTSGTDYRRRHTKTTIVVAQMDLEAHKIGYFHNAGYFELGGEDFAGLFRTNLPEDPAFLPLFAEVVRLDRIERLSETELARHSLGLLRTHFPRRPLSNPVAAFGARFARDLPELQDRGLDFYHLWAFSTIRQLGAAAELAALNLEWLADQRVLDARRAATDFTAIASGAKSLILKGARAVNSRRPLDVAAPCGEMSSAWDRAMQSLDEALQAA